MLPGQTFRIATRDWAHPLLRPFMLLQVAGECPTTIHTTVCINPVLDLDGQPDPKATVNFPTLERVKSKLQMLQFELSDCHILQCPGT